MIWVIISTFALLFSLAVTYWIHNQYQLDVQVDPHQIPSLPLPLISVIIPARNEARNIAASVKGLLRQTYPNIELIVIDDRSTDATPQILEALASEDPRLSIIHGQPLSPGWAGKPHALSQGAQAAQGEWLCFIDADTFACPELLSASLAAARQTEADLFTIMTEQELHSFWEKVILPIVFTALSVGFSPRRVNDPARPDAVANGQFLLFRREAYQAIGGHLSVANSIVEDRDLAQKIKQAGLRLIVADGRAVASTRMYTCFSEIWEGWTKNIFLGLSGQPGLALLGVFGAIISLLGALGFPFWIASGAVWLVHGGSFLALLVLLESLLAFGYLTYVRGQAAQAFHISALYGLTLPLGALIFAAMMITSTYNILSGQGVTWKGRRYLARD